MRITQLLGKLRFNNIDQLTAFGTTNSTFVQIVFFRTDMSSGVVRPDYPRHVFSYLMYGNCVRMDATIKLFAPFRPFKS